MSYINPNIKLDRSSGAYVYNGKNRYIDLCLGNGTHIYGHNKFEIDKGTLYGVDCSSIDEFNEIFKKYTGCKTILCNSGSEATMRACRIARAVTGKDKIAIFEGSWHGSADWSLKTAGVPKAVQDLCVELPYHSYTALDMIRAMKDELAMVFIEPVQGGNPIDARVFLNSLRKVTEECGVLLGFDEVLCGFRVKTDIKPDITTYGKALGYGFPIGAVATNLKVKDVTLGGTFSGNPLTVRSAIRFLKRLEEEPPLEHMNRLAERLRKEIKIKGTRMVGVGSISRITFTELPYMTRDVRDILEDKDLKNKVFEQALNRGVFVGKNGILFTSYKHTDKDIDEVVSAFNLSCSSDIN